MSTIEADANVVTLDSPISRITDVLADLDDDEITAEAIESNHKIIQSSLVLLHEADVADLLESLSKSKRQIIWPLIDISVIGQVLLEVGNNLCEDLIELTPTDTMVTMLKTMDPDHVASLMRELPKSDAARFIRLANLSSNSEIRASLSFKDNTVGSLMDFQPVIASELESVGKIVERLQKNHTLPSQCDKLFIVDDWERLAGILPLKRLLLNESNVIAKDIMITENIHTFTTDVNIDIAVGAFERYDLISAPVIDEKHKVIGRIIISEVFDHVHEEQNADLLTSAGITDKEDLFASVGERFRNRWWWLFINLIAAILISRIIGLFEASIEQLVALAVLMPIVAGMCGNIGNQTATLIIRALALQQIKPNNWVDIIKNEAKLSIVNGLLWGGLVGIFAYFLYQRLDLSIVLLAAMTLCALCGAIAGFFVPITMQRLGRDPALGTTVVISVVTDSLGFLFFLGMATLFLL